MTADRRLFLKAAAASALAAPASAVAPAVNRDFWTSAYQAIDD
jgi:hypothetical protein